MLWEHKGEAAALIKGKGSRRPHFNWSLRRSRGHKKQMHSLLVLPNSCGLPGPVPGEAAAPSSPSPPSLGPTTASSLPGSWTQWPSKPSLSRTWVSGCWTVGGQTWWSKRCPSWGPMGSTPWANRYRVLWVSEKAPPRLHHGLCPIVGWKQKALDRGSPYWWFRVIFFLNIL